MRLPSMMVLPKILITREYLTGPSSRTFHKITSLKITTKYQGREVQGSLRNSFRLKESKETGQLNAACDPGLELFVGKKYCVEVLRTIDEI